MVKTLSTPHPGVTAPPEPGTGEVDMHEKPPTADSDVRWSIRLVASPTSPVPELVPADGTPLRLSGAVLVLDGRGLVARFEVAAPDAERASMRSLTRWRRVGAVLGISDWPVCTLVVERSGPSARASRSTRSAAGPSYPILDLREPIDPYRSSEMSPSSRAESERRPLLHLVDDEYHGHR